MNSLFDSKFQTESLFANFHVTGPVISRCAFSVFVFSCPTNSARALPNIIGDKTAELSQRRPRDAPNIWVHWKVLTVLTTHPATYPEICNGLLFRSILRMCVQNLKFVALPVPEIIVSSIVWALPHNHHCTYLLTDDELNILRLPYALNIRCPVQHLLTDDELNMHALIFVLQIFLL